MNAPSIPVCNTSGKVELLHPPVMAVHDDRIAWITSSSSNQQRAEAVDAEITGANRRDPFRPLTN